MTDYEKFHQLHYQYKPMILANAWNAKSAQIAEKSGFKAVATASRAIAESLGCKDGEQIPFPELMYMVQRIKASISIPLSVDIERGYTTDLEVLNEHFKNYLTMA
ncbi:MAG TPA: isocitrate lyase/phosphoenolpyruvate mutase family protein [Chitinophagaceae bacterium]|nr:isocitrate lyase/phosphoenolpyruvate mutase family protein [Chitinophagaceae bacterium]